MTAGLPSTGVGSIYYFINIPIMVCVELTRLFKGTSSLKSWKLIGQQLGMLLGMLGNGVLTGIGVEQLLTNPTARSLINTLSSPESTQQLQKTLPPNVLVATPFVTLLSVIAMVFALRLIFAAKYRLASLLN